MSAKNIALILGGHRIGSGWMARCPAHNDHTPSLSIRDAYGTTLVRCHAGCDQREVISALRRRGLWAEKIPRSRARRAGRIPFAIKQSRAEGGRIEMALAIWHSAVPAEGTLVEHYLKSRRIELLAPDALRFHVGVKHSAGGIWPAMIALVTNGADATPLAIHRTYLALNGSGKAQISPQKMMLGPCRGGVVRLAEPGDVLMVGEGIETCLAAMQATGHAAWAALSRLASAPSICRGWCAMSSFSPTATKPAKQRRATVPCVGNAKAGACASPVRHKGWISTTCCWAARLASRRPRNEDLG